MPHNLGNRIRHARLGRVFVLYGSVTFGALQVVEMFTERFGWTDALFTGTLVLAALGLPVVVATALVYGGHRIALRAEREDAADASHDGAGSHPAAAPPLASSRPRPRLSWAKSTGLIAAGFAVLLLSTGAFMAMRTFGIGPAGTLLARGVLDHRDPIIVADFESAAADSALARVVTDAFRIDLSQSPSITVIQPLQLQQTLRMMNVRDAASLNAELARNAALRSGVKAVVTGELTGTGSGYLLTARLVTADSGKVLVAHRESAANVETLIPAIDRLSKRIRERIGESLRTVRAEPLAQVTTSSIEALRLYTQAMHASDIEGDVERAVTLLDGATRADSTFAMAHRKLGIILLGGADYERGLRAFEAAYRHRDRLSDRERYLAEAAYFTFVTGEPERAAVAYRTVLGIDPDNETALNNLSVRLIETGDLAEAERLLERAVAVDSLTYHRHVNLAMVRFRLGRADDAHAALERMKRVMGGGPNYEQAAAQIAAAQFDYETALAHAVAIAEAGPGAGWRATSLQLQAMIHQVRGRLDEAESLLHRALREVPGFSEPARRLQRELFLAQTDWTRRGPDAAAARVDAALRATDLAALAPHERPHLGIAQVYSIVGRPAQAREHLRLHDTVVPEALRRAAAGPRAAVDGFILAAEGRSEDALRVAREAELGEECISCNEFLRAWIFDLAERTDSAIVAYERYLSAPTPNRLNMDAALLPFAYERLAALHERQGNAAAARTYLARFVELWGDADASLQPRVDAARQRIQALLRG